MAFIRRIESFLYGDDDPAPRRSTHARMTVLVDHREQAGGFAAAVQDRLCSSHEVQITPLERGDVVIGGIIVLERKRADDFVASLRDGRLFHQAAALAEEFSERAMIIEGTFSTDAVGSTNPDALRGAMISLQFDWGIRLIRSRDVFESASYVALLADRLARRTSGRLRAPRADPSAKTGVQPATHEVVEAMLAVLPGVGPARAAAIASAYPEMRLLLAATQRDFERIEGVGKVGARRLFELLHPKVPGGG